MSTTQAKSVDLTRAKNIRSNLQRIFAAHPRGFQASAARAAGITTVHLSRLVGSDNLNPAIDTIESLSLALEITVETLISAGPSDADLRILQDSSRIPTRST
jgi:transcriptional regulator with XRE-family HTH domain